MRPIEDPSTQTPNERLTELAYILATGILRLHTRVALPPNGPNPAQTTENRPDSAPPSLDLSAQTGLTVHTG
jgi:hypothetical protein